MKTYWRARDQIVEPELGQFAHAKPDLAVAKEGRLGLDGLDVRGPGEQLFNGDDFAVLAFKLAGEFDGDLVPPVLWDFHRNAAEFGDHVVVPLAQVDAVGLDHQHYEFAWLAGISN
ncbi:MAG: hypothetical protein HUU46_18680 [Candidatus Hydrogenedentes bacterium]|nr:hypothetical protein [Candidatus Hydrogenedentota bacterium]